MRVGEAKQRDIGKKRARIGPDAMDYLQVTPGDVIQINANQVCSHTPDRRINLLIDSLLDTFIH